MADDPDTAETKEETVRELKFFLPFKQNGEEIDPWIIIDEDRGKIRVRLNQYKKYRAMHFKNIICQATDILLVDEIKNLLESLAKKEEQAEKNINKQGGDKSANKVRKSGRTSGHGERPGHSEAGKSDSSPGSGEFL